MFSEELRVKARKERNQTFDPDFFNYCQNDYFMNHSSGVKVSDIELRLDYLWCHYKNY